MTRWAARTALLVALLGLGAPAVLRAQMRAARPVPRIPELAPAMLAAEESGYEYLSLFRDAWDPSYAGSEEALRVLMGMAASFGEQAAGPNAGRIERDAVRANGRALSALMQERGDSAFAAVLAKEAGVVRWAVVDAISDLRPAAAWSNFPRTAALGRTGRP